MASLNVKSISQHKMRRYQELKNAVSELESLKREIIDLLLSGLPCQPGPLSCKLKKRAGQRRPAWKDELIKIADQFGLDSKGLVEEIVKSTPQGDPSYSVELFDRENPTS